MPTSYYCKENAAKKFILKIPTPPHIHLKNFRKNPMTKIIFILKNPKKLPHLLISPNLLNEQQPVEDPHSYRGRAEVHIPGYVLLHSKEQETNAK